MIVDLATSSHAPRCRPDSPSGCLRPVGLVRAACSQNGLLCWAEPQIEGGRLIQPGDGSSPSGSLAGAVPYSAARTSGGSGWRLRIGTLAIASTAATRAAPPKTQSIRAGNLPLSRISQMDSAPAAATSAIRADLSQRRSARTVRGGTARRGAFLRALRARDGRRCHQVVA